MSQEVSTIQGVSGATPDPGVSTAVDSPSTTGADSNSSANVTTSPSDQQATATASEQTEDPLAGLPTIEEVEKMDTVSKEAFLRLRGAYDQVKPQFDEISGKYKVFEPVADRFSAPEEVQKIVEMQDALFGYAQDPQSGKLVPTTDKFAESLPPLQAETLAADLAMAVITGPNGQQYHRFEPMLSVIAENPALKERALRALGVDPNQQSVTAPAWTPTAEELEMVKPEFHEIYKKLPFEDREELKLNSPDFINKTLQQEQINQRLMQQEQVRVEQAQQYRQQQEQAVEQEAVQAGNTYTNEQVQQGFSGLYENIVQQWQPTDDPQVNKIAAFLVASAAVNISHRETRGVLNKALTELGLLDEKSLQNFDAALNGFAQNAHHYGYLSHKGSKNGNGQVDPSVNILKTNANRGIQSVVAHSNNLANRFIKAIDKLFVAKAEAHNQTLAQAAGARPPINGAPVNPAVDRQAPAIAGAEPFSRESVSRFVRS